MKLIARMSVTNFLIFFLQKNIVYELMYFPFDVGQPQGIALQKNHSEYSKWFFVNNFDHNRFW